MTPSAMSPSTWSRYSGSAASCARTVSSVAPETMRAKYQATGFITCLTRAGGGVFVASATPPACFAVARETPAKQVARHRLQDSVAPALCLFHGGSLLGIGGKQRRIGLSALPGP